VTLRGKVAWAVPFALGALTLVLIAAVVIARREQPSRALVAVAPDIVNGGQGTPPEIAALNAQLAQIAALRAGARYGTGLTHVVRGPVASLRPALGEEWRELGQSVGRVWLYPTGALSPYFEVSAVVVAQHGPARLELLTTEGQRVVQAVGAAPFQVVNLGPLLAPAHGGVGVAVSSIQPHSNSPGPSLILSPLQAEYLPPGEYVTGMPALEEVGPGGLRGVYLRAGSTTRFAMTPGVRCACSLALRGASVGGSLQVSLTVGSEVRSSTVTSRSAVVRIGPFSQAGSVVSLGVRQPASGSNGSLFVGDLRFVAGPP
jgi:hypothetical protein